MDTIEESEQNEVEHDNSESHSGASSSSDTGGESVYVASKSQDFVSQFETEDTKLLSSEQLERIVLLQKVQVLELKKKKLELQISNSNPILFDISALNASNVLNI